MIWQACIVAVGVFAAKGDDTAVPRDNPIFPPGAKLERLFERSANIHGGLTEGPALAPDGSIYFTDIPSGVADDTRIERFDPATGQVDLFTDKAGKANGLTFDRDGNLLACDGADGGGRCVTRWNVETRKPTVVVDRYQGHRFNAPNDLCVDRKGRIYFTDPHYGEDEPLELARQSVYRFDPDGKLSLTTDKVEKPNGIVLSPDERTLYVGDHNNAGHPPKTDPKVRPGAMTVLAFDLDEAGLVKGAPRTLVDFSPENGCDGITVDAVGNIYLTCRSMAKPGIMVIDRDGKELAFLPTGPPNQTSSIDDAVGLPSNVEFGADQGPETMLYVTVDKALYRIPSKQHGVRPAWAKPSARKN
jgi:gluconolactonase